MYDRKTTAPHIPAIIKKMLLFLKPLKSKNKSISKKKI